MTVKMILFPSSYQDINKVDEDLQKEYEAVLQTGLFDVSFFSYDKWFNENKLAVTHIPDEETSAVYRGWMMQPEQYTRFYNLLLEKNIRLITDPKQYELMHIFPNVYKYIEEDTARIETYPLHGQINVENLKQSFDKFMVKDYVKSVKGTEFPTFFDRSVTQEEFDRWMKVFYKYRNGLLTGGICIKEFLDLKRYGNRTNEYRVFYINHEIASVWRNSGQSDYTPEPPEDFISKYRALESPFYTIDYAELDDGTWKILEAGDGEVSGLSDNQDYLSFFRALFYCFENESDHRN